MDFSNNHLWKTVRIGKARTDGQFDVVWQSDHPVRPAPFPFYRPNLEWAAMQKAGIQHPGQGAAMMIFTSLTRRLLLWFVLVGLLPLVLLGYLTLLLQRTNTA